MSKFSQEYIESFKKDLDVFPHDQVEQFVSALMEAHDQHRQIFIMGNGGSASAASHWICDVNKDCSSATDERFRMICLNDNIPVMLAYANDQDYSDIFVEQLKNLFVPGDLVIVISGSGNSPNVVKAVEYAHANKGVTVGICGFDGGKLRDRVKIPVIVKVKNMQRVENIHMIVMHVVRERLLQELSKKS